MAKDEKIIAYKGFNADFKCRGYQFKVGESYTCPTAPVRCTSSGFHACDSPLDVFQYYNDGPVGKFAEVEASGQIDRTEAYDTKFATTNLVIKAEIPFAKFLRLGIEICFKKTEHFEIIKKIRENKIEGIFQTKDDKSHSSTTGYKAHSSTAGEQAHSSTAGEHSIACALGNDSKVRSKKKGILILIHYNKDGKPVKVVTEIVGKNKIKSDTWYKLSAKGKFVICKG